MRSTASRSWSPPRQYVGSEGRGRSLISQLPRSRMEDCWAKKHRLSVPSICQNSHCATCVTKRTIQYRITTSGHNETTWVCGRSDHGLAGCPSGTLSFSREKSALIQRALEGHRRTTETQLACTPQFRVIPGRLGNGHQNQGAPRERSPIARGAIVNAWHYSELYPPSSRMRQSPMI